MDGSMWRLRLVLVNSCDCIICLDKYQEPGLDHLADWQRTVEILLLDPIGSLVFTLLVSLRSLKKLKPF